MLELASQRGFCVQIQPYASAPFSPWDVESAGLPRSSEKGMANCPVAGPRTSPYCRPVQGNRACRETSALSPGGSRHDAVWLASQRTRKP